LQNSSPNSLRKAVGPLLAVRLSLLCPHDDDDDEDDDDEDDDDDDADDEDDDDDDEEEEEEEERRMWMMRALLFGLPSGYPVYEYLHHTGVWRRLVVRSGRGGKEGTSTL